MTEKKINKELINKKLIVDAAIALVDWYSAAQATGKKKLKKIFGKTTLMKGKKAGKKWIIVGVVIVLVGWHFAAQSIGKGKVEEALYENNLDDFISYESVSTNSLTLTATLNKVDIEFDLPSIWAPKKTISLEIDKVVIKEFSNDDDDAIEADIELVGIPVDLVDTEQNLFAFVKNEQAKLLHQMGYTKLKIDIYVKLNHKKAGKTELSLVWNVKNGARLSFEFEGKGLNKLNVSDLLVSSAQMDLDNIWRRLKLHELKLVVENQGGFDKYFKLMEKSEIRYPDDKKDKRLVIEKKDIKKFVKEGKELGLQSLPLKKMAEAFEDFVKSPDTLGFKITSKQGVKAGDVFAAINSSGNSGKRKMRKLVKRIELDVID